MCMGEKAFPNDFAVHELAVSGRKLTMFRADNFVPSSEIDTLAEKIEGWTIAILNIDPAKQPTAVDDIKRRIDSTAFAVAGVQS